VRYKKIEIELIVIEEEAEIVAAKLDSALDHLADRYEIFDGTIKASTIAHGGKPRKSALKHTLAAGETAVAAVRMAGSKVADAFRAVI